jgi:hypothetical protein
MTQPEQSNSRLIFRYVASRANGTTQTGTLEWPSADRGRGFAKHAVDWLMRWRFNRATVTLDGIEVGGINQDRPGGRRHAWWDASA